MFYYYQVAGGEEAWKPTSEGTVAGVIEESKPMFVTALSVNKLVEDLTPDQRDKLAYSGPFYIDWDGPDIDSVVLKVIEFMEKLRELRFDLSMARWYATGSKGFHCEIPAECFVEKLKKDAGIPNLPVVYKEMVFQLYVDTIDMRVYSQGRGRMWRQTNVERENKKFKVQVTVDELRKMDSKEYAKVTSSPREMIPTTPASLCPQLSIIYAKAAQTVDEKLKTRKTRKRDPNAKERATCSSVKWMMSGIGIKESAGFHELALQIAIIAATANMTEEQMLSDSTLLIEGHQGNGTRYNTPVKRREELSRMFRYVSDNPMYEFSIGAIKSLLTHPAPDLDGITASDADIQEAIEEAAEDAKIQAGLPEDERRTPDEFNDVAGGVTLSKFGVYVSEESGGKRRICAVSFKDIHLLMSAENGQLVAYSALLLVNGKSMSRVTIEMETFQSLQMFNRFAARFGHAMQGTETHMRGLFMRFIELAKKKGRQLYIAKREGLDIFNIPHHDDRDLREPFMVWADGKGVLLEPRVQGKNLEISFQGFPNAEGVFKTDLRDSPELTTWVEEEGNRESLKLTLRNMLTCQRADVMSKMIGWYVACFYRMVFHKAYMKFPLLHVYGSAGSGKTEMTLVMLSLFYYNQEPKTLTPQSSVFSLQQHMSASTSIPLVLDEYKPHDLGFEQLNKLKLLFRDAYNLRDVSKGGGNRESDDYRSLSNTQLSAPLSFIGEAAEDEAAIAERVVLISVVKPASSISLKWLARFQHWSRNKKQMTILGQYLAAEAINTTTLKGFTQEFDVLFEQAREKYMLTEADLSANLDEKTLQDKQNAKERSVYNFTVARFGLLRFKRLVDAIFGPAEFAEIFAELDSEVYTRMADLQPSTQAEWAKVLDTFATMTYALDGDSSWVLREDREYKIGVVVGREVIEISMQNCYMKYRAWMRSTGSKSLFSGSQSFVMSIKDSPALVRYGHGDLLEQPGIYQFDLTELKKMKVGDFK